MQAGTLICTSELATHHEAINETEPFVVKVPEQVGEDEWTVLFPGYETDGTVHEEGCLVVSFATRPHTTSMAVWDVPSPVVMNRVIQGESRGQMFLGLQPGGAAHRSLR